MGFPASPINGQQVRVNGKSYVYNSAKGSWAVVVSTGSLPGTVVTPAGTVSGNLVITDDLTVANDAAVSGTLTVTGNTDVGGVLTVGSIKTDNFLYANGSQFVSAGGGGGGAGSGLTLDAGSILFSISNTAPNSFIAANGAAINNNAYPNLNAAINANSALRISGTSYIINVIGSKSAPAGTTYNASTAIDAGRGASKAFDGSLDGTSGCWHSSGAPPQWIRVTFTTPTVINKWDWQRRAQNDLYPTNWTLSGSNDGGTTKTLLYTKTGDGGVASGSWNENQFTNSNAYTTYQMDISASSGGSYVVIGEIRCASVGDNTQFYLPNYTTGLPTGVYAYVATSAVGGSGASSGVTTYATPNLLPLSSTAGTMAYVLSNNRLYIYNSGWYAIAAVNQTPTFSNTPGTEVYLGDNAATYTYTLQAADPEGINLTYGYSVVSGNVSNAAINSSTGVFSANLSSIDSANITFTASDGINTATATSTFYYLDPYFEYNTLLLKAVGSNAQTNSTFLDSSTNNVTITRNGDVTQGAFTPYSVADGYWGNFFDGSGDYLTVPNNAAFNFGTGDFTVECWIYTTSANSGSTHVIASTYQDSTNGWTLGVYTNTNVLYFAVAGDSAQFNDNVVVPLNQWVHVAAVRSGTTMSLFVNGTRKVTGSNSTNQTSTSALTIGTNVGGGVLTHTGYISNLRVVKGTAVYDPSQSSITVPTTPLTAISGTSLLTCQSNRFKDNSTNNFTVTRYGDAKVSAFGPFNPSTAYSSTNVGGSLYFDGTGDYLTAPYNTTDFDWWTADYTIEAWVYIPTLTGWSMNDGTRDIPTLVGNMRVGDNTNYWSFGPIVNGTVRLYYFNGTTQTGPTSTETVKLGQWNHIAATKTSSGVTIFVNGVASTTTAINGTPQSSGSGTPLTIGAYQGTVINGYVSNLRIVRGTAVYSGNFTPPSAPLTAITNTKFLASGTNAGVVDASRKNTLSMIGSTAVSTVQKKFSSENSISGAASAYILASASPELEFGSGDFTIEMWWYPTSTIRQALYHGSWGTDWSVGIDYSSVSTNQKIGIWASSNGTAWNLINADAGGNGIGTTSLTQNAWNHIAFVRNGNTWMLFVNGNRDLNLTGISGSIISRVTSQKAIGAWFSEAAMQEQLGYLQDFRISKYARYTASFTVPTGPFLTR